MEEEVMAIASSEFGRIETASALQRRKKVKKLKAWRFVLRAGILSPNSYRWFCFDFPVDRLGVYCYNFQKGTNLKFVRWEKYNTEYTGNEHYYITSEAMDPACNSVFSFQTLFSLAGYTTVDNYVIDTWRIFACRPRCKKPVDDYWDRHDQAIDKFYTCPIMPKWLSDEALASDNKKYYVVQESELHENEWLHLFIEIVFYSKASSYVVASPPFEINKVVVETKEDYITEAREKLQAENAIFYISYKYRGVSSSGFAGDHKVIVRKTMDGEPGHMSLEFAYVQEEE